MTVIKILDKCFKLYISKHDLDKHQNETAKRILEDYKDIEDLVVLIVLNGAFMVGSDMVRKISPIVTTISTIKPRSYEGTKSTGEVKMDLRLTVDVSGKPVLLIEDIVESGRTLDVVNKMLKDAGATSVEICSMFIKPNIFNRYKDQHQHYSPSGVKYACIGIRDEFIVGYGLDYNHHGREYEDVYILCGDEEYKNNQSLKSKVLSRIVDVGQSIRRGNPLFTFALGLGLATLGAVTWGKCPFINRSLRKVTGTATAD